MIQENKINVDSLNKYKSVIFLLPIFFIFVLLWIKEFEHKTYRALVREDGLIEYLTFLNYLLAFLITISIARLFWKSKIRSLSLVFAFLGFCFLFVAGEEISWGQRILRYASGEFFLENSIQRETNLHNLKAVHLYVNHIFIIVGLIGSFAWIIRTLIISCFGRHFRHSAIKFCTPDWFVSSYFIPTLLFFFYIEYLFPQIHIFNIRFKEQEPVEWILSLGFLIFTVCGRFDQPKTIRNILLEK